MDAMKSLALLLVSVLCLPLLALADKHDGAFYIQNTKSHLVIQVQNCKKVSSANLISAKKEHHESSNVDCQLFIYDPVKKQIISLLDGPGRFVVDISGGTGGDHVIAYPSHDGANQKWDIMSNEIICPKASKLLTEKGENQVVGAEKASGTDSQKFVCVPFAKSRSHTINPKATPIIGLAQPNATATKDSASAGAVEEIVECKPDEEAVPVPADNGTGASNRTATAAVPPVPIVLSTVPPSPNPQSR